MSFITITDSIYLLFLAWGIYSYFQINKLRKTQDLNSVNPYIYDSIPSVFTTLGILGTFSGIYIGLFEFDVNQIDASIPKLLDGLKTAFLTSILGIILSLIFSKITKLVYSNVERSQPELPSTEITSLNKILEVLERTEKSSISNFKELISTINGEGDNSISTQLLNLRNLSNYQLTSLESQFKVLEKISFALESDNESSIMSQLKRVSVDQNLHSKELIKNIGHIVSSMDSNSKTIEAKFEEFSILLAKNNTEALVEVMKKATEEFNNQMSALVNKLVQENFAELNNSVQMLNQWQKDNKEMISKLTDQFKSVSNDFTHSSSVLKEVSINTSTLTDKNSQLVQIVDSLKKVMVYDTKFNQITDKVSGAVDLLKANIEAFDQTANQLNQWVKKQKDFSESVTKLLVRLEEIDKIKDINEVFWKNLKSQLNDGVSILQKSIKDLDNEVENIHGHFYEKLNDTFQNLDNLIQRIVTKYNK